jgi:hypothetical protein
MDTAQLTLVRQPFDDPDFLFELNHDGFRALAHIWEGKCELVSRWRQVFAGQAVGIKEVHDDIWLVSFMDYDLGYFDLDTRVLEPLENPFGPKVLPM